MQTRNRKDNGNPTLVAQIARHFKLPAASAPPGGNQASQFAQFIYLTQARPPRRLLFSMHSLPWCCQGFCSLQQQALPCLMCYPDQVWFPILSMGSSSAGEVQWSRRNLVSHTSMQRLCLHEILADSLSTTNRTISGD